MPAAFLPVEEIYEQRDIYTNARDPYSIIDTKPLNTISHREEYFSFPIVSYLKSSEPHV